jgi:glycosyltransferase involved in cell wall biosynthesis
MRGDQIIAFYRIRYLAQRHEVALLSFVESEAEVEQAAELTRHCAAVHTVRLPQWRSVLNMALGFTDGLPLQAHYYASAAFERQLQVLVEGGSFDVVHSVLARVSAPLLGIRGPVRISDMVDALSLTMARRAAASHHLERWVYSLEARRMRDFEQQLCREMEGVIVVSEKDRDYLGAPRVTVIPAGVEIEPRPRPERSGPRTVIFTGNFEYYPNVDAAEFLLREIWPAVRRAVGEARLKIVGNNPPARLARLAEQQPGAEVTGYVEDLAAHLLEADVAVSPVRLGGAGMHRKVLEAMACGTPVVVSPLVTGFRAQPGEDLLVAEDVPGYVAAIRSVLEDPERARRMSERGRRIVAENYSWEGTTRQLEDYYLGLREIPRARGARA